MKLHFPSIDKRPIVFVAVHSGGHRLIMPMILDTGSDTTCFPATFDLLLGHNNGAPGVVKKPTNGVGGKADSYLHTGIEISLLDPCSPEQKPEENLPDTVWTSSITSFHFLDGFHIDFGLLGRDIMHEWKSFTMRPDEDEWVMEIEI